MKATFNKIVENLVTVLTDKAETAQYYSDNEQYIYLCGWCGTMSPISRPAYYKTFGKDTTEQAEVKAREIIAEKKAARQRTKYAEHAHEADRLEGVPAVGGFFWADNSGLKCDGGRGLFEELHNLTYYTHADEEQPARLCYVEQIINVSDEEFNRPGLADELVTRHNLQGFCRSEDVDEDDNDYYNDPEKLATFFTVGTLVVSPSGKYFLIDSEGYSYARYIYVPIEWPVMLADELETVKAAEEKRKAEQERQAAEEKARRLAQYRERCAKWSPLMRDVEKMEQEKATARKIDNARKANILAMCAAAFPGVKFSVSVRRGWGADFELTWTDGPTEEEFNEKTDLDLFCSRRDTFNGWDDSTDVDFAEFAEFARMTMGSNGGDIKITREMSDEARAALIADICAAVPAADVTDKYGYYSNYTFTAKEAEAVAAALGVGVFDVFAFGYNDNAAALARRAWNLRSYTKPSEPTDPTPTKRTDTTEEERTDTAAPSQDTAQTDDAPAEGLELVNIAEGVAVVGDSRTTYRNRKAIKAHGAKWNKEAQQWQASEPEAVARLREWFGVSITPTAEEGDTAHESEPQHTDTDRTEQDGHTHTTASEQQEAPTADTPTEAAPTATAEELTATPTTAPDESEAERLRRELAAMLDQARRMSDRLAQLEQAEQIAAPTAPTEGRAA
nr:MAG TPA: Large polyvalent protein associated domain 29 [Caudoviricetes sp.]